MSERLSLIESLMERFPGVPREAVLKEDLLRTGIAFTEAALSDNLDGAVKPKSYFIFSFDQQPLANLGEAATRRPPEEIALTGGPYGFRRTIVSVRVNPGSPYRVGRDEDGELRLAVDDSPLADVTLPPMPEYYRHTLANGKTVMETAPTIQWGYLIYLTVLRLCQYFGAKEECQFCDINHNWRQHKQAGRPYTGIKPVEDVLEALTLIDEYDTAEGEPRVHAHRRLRHEQGRRARGGRLLRALRAGDRGALPRPLDRQGRRAGAPARGRPALPRLRHLHLPPELRGLGRAAVQDHLPGQGALRRAGRVAPADPRGGRGVRPAARDPELRRRRRDGAAARVRERRRRDREHGRGARLLHEPRQSRPASPPGARSRRRRSAATTRTARRSSTTCACSRPTATRWRSTVSSLRPATARPARATRSSRSARSWTCSRPRQRRCRRDAHHDRRGGPALERGDGRRVDRTRPGRAGAVAPARPRDLHGHADHQLHERLCRAVRLLRLLRAPEPGRRLRPLARGRVREDRRARRRRRRPRRLQRRLQPEAAARATTATSSTRCASATASGSSSTR